MITSEPFSTPLLDTLANQRSGTVLAINKPLHWTSFDIVKKLRAILRIKKIGHTGTLDPLATGLLILCTEGQTKTIHQYQDLEKVYKGEMILGKTTPSIDLETAFDSETPYTHIAIATIHQLIPTFLGTIDQVPPAYSAVKRHGKRAYESVRKGTYPTLLPRKVFIRSFVITSVKLPSIQFEVTCGKGTYIRSLVRDFGQKLGVGAYLKDLCRTRIGSFLLKDAHDVTTFGKTPV